MTPIINYSTTQLYNSVWMDHGSHANADVGFWRPSIDQNSNFFFGDYAQNGYDNPNQSMIFVSSVDNDDPNNPALMAPQGFNPIWAYAVAVNFGPTIQFNLNVIWNIIPPNNYVACGSVVSNTGFIDPSAPIPTPSIPNLRCLRYDLASEQPGGNLSYVWNDKGSGNDRDVTAWMVPNLHNMLAVGNYDTPSYFYLPSNLPKLAHTYGVG